MSDKNKNSRIDPDEAKGIVDEEETVNEALVDEVITDEKAAGVVSLDKLEEEAKRIEMEEGMGAPSDFTQIKKEDFISQSTEEKKGEKEQPAQAQAPTPPEATAEISKEPTSEVTQEGVKEIDELTSEFKKG